MTIGLASLSLCSFAQIKPIAKNSFTMVQTSYDAIKYKTPTGNNLTCKGWIQEAALRMLLNNLNPEVAERPDELIVYGGRGKAARNFEALDNIIKALKVLENDETLLIQSGKPVGIMKTHKDAPRVLISNSQLVPNWANWDHFDELEKKGLMMYGQMTAGSWIYIGSQGIVQGTYETYAAIAEKYFKAYSRLLVCVPPSASANERHCILHRC